MNVARDLSDLLKDAVNEIGVTIRAELAGVAAYAAERAAHLATIANEPGFELAVRAERDAVALRAGIGAVQQADAADARVVGIIHGVLLTGARALAGPAA